MCIYIYTFFKMLLQHITLELQKFSCFSSQLISFHFILWRARVCADEGHAGEMDFWLLPEEYFRPVLFCYMFNMHTCASGMTQVNDISDFSFLERHSSRFFTCPWISTVLNTLVSNRPGVAQWMVAHGTTDPMDYCPNPSTAELPLLGPWTRPLTLHPQWYTWDKSDRCHVLSSLRVALDKYVCQML